jgi:hypothetical protein
LLLLNFGAVAPRRPLPGRCRQKKLNTKKDFFLPGNWKMSKDIKRLQALSEVCLAHTEIISLQKEFILLNGKKQKHKMKDLAAKMKSCVVMIR